MWRVARWTINIRWIVDYSLPHYEELHCQAIRNMEWYERKLQRFWLRYPPQRDLGQQILEDDIYESKWTSLKAFLTLLQHYIDIFPAELEANRLLISSPDASFAQIKTRFLKMDALAKSMIKVMKDIQELIDSDAGMI
jgi:hypothetical protein